MVISVGMLLLGWLSISAAASPPLRLRAASVRRATTLRGMPPSPPLPPAAAKGPTIVRISPSNTHHLLPLSRTYLPPAILRSNAVSDHTRVVSTVDPTPHTHTSARAFSYPTYYPHHARVVMCSIAHLPTRAVDPPRGALAGCGVCASADRVRRRHADADGQAARHRDHHCA